MVEIAIESIIYFLLFSGGITSIILLLKSLVNVGTSLTKTGKSSIDLAVEVIKSLKDRVIDEQEREKLLALAETVEIQTKQTQNAMITAIGHINRIAMWFINRNNKASIS